MLQGESVAVHPAALIRSGPSHAAKGGVPPPPIIMVIARAFLGLLTATAAPAMPWLSLNVITVDFHNDRLGDSPSSYRAREVPPVTARMHARMVVVRVSRKGAVGPKHPVWRITAGRAR